MDKTAEGKLGAINGAVMAAGCVGVCGLLGLEAAWPAEWNPDRSEGRLSGLRRSRVSRVDAGGECADAEGQAAFGLGDNSVGGVPLRSDDRAQSGRTGTQISTTCLPSGCCLGSLRQISSGGRSSGWNPLCGSQPP